MLSNKTPYDKQGANKYYTAYLNSDFKPLYISIKNIELYTNCILMYVSYHNTLKYGTRLRLHSTKRFIESGFTVTLHIIMNTSEQK